MRSRMKKGLRGMCSRYVRNNRCDAMRDVKRKTLTTVGVFLLSRHNISELKLVVR